MGEGRRPFAAQGISSALVWRLLVKALLGLGSKQDGLSKGKVMVMRPTVSGAAGERACLLTGPRPWSRPARE